MLRAFKSSVAMRARSAGRLASGSRASRGPVRRARPASGRRRLPGSSPSRGRGARGQRSRSAGASSSTTKRSRAGSMSASSTMAISMSAAVSPAGIVVAPALSVVAARPRPAVAGSSSGAMRQETARGSASGRPSVAVRTSAAALRGSGVAGQRQQGADRDVERRRGAQALGVGRGDRDRRVARADAADAHCAGGRVHRDRAAVRGRRVAQAVAVRVLEGRVEVDRPRLADVELQVRQFLRQARRGVDGLRHFPRRCGGGGAVLPVGHRHHADLVAARRQAVELEPRRGRLLLPRRRPFLPGKTPLHLVRRRAGGGRPGDQQAGRGGFGAHFGRDVRRPAAGRRRRPPLLRRSEWQGSPGSRRRRRRS